MWRELISGLCGDCGFHPPATVQDIQAAEKSLYVNFPDALQDLLLETNGVANDPFGSRFILSASDIQTENLNFRSVPTYAKVYMPFDALLFFADAGNGDYFAFPIVSSGARDDVFVWNHEDDSRYWVAPNLKTFIERWLAGELAT